MAGKSDSPLLKALPPETDYLSYLTLLEYNLTTEQLPTLHDILQDTTLTTNIGWDLVHLLLPLLPASQQCMQDVARLGNPREVVLKVTELLEGLGNVEEDEEEEEDEEDEELREEAEKTHQLELQESSTQEDVPSSEVHPALRTDETIKPPSKSLKFISLIEMLAILHPRIKTKYPSRFLSTSLQAILPAYMQVARRIEATEAVLSFIKDLSGTKRPRLPPRKSSSQVPTRATPKSAPDPEGSDEAVGADEVALQTRLFQSFLTFITEGYMSSMELDDDVPGMAWSSRYQEKQHPEKTIPRRRTYSSLFVEEEHLHERDAVTGQILALLRDLKISAEELLSSIMKQDEEEMEEEAELPSAASDVPLSRTGSLYLLATMAASSALFHAPASLPPLRLVPDFAAILASSLGDAATGSTGVEPEPLIDAVLFLGFLIMTAGQGVPTDNDPMYNNILQRLSLLSANIPSAGLRYHAHLLTSKVLHSHPSDHVRLAFIQDTLEHCPYENLKGSAVGWLKYELLATEKSVQEEKVPHADLSIFSTPGVLTTLAPFLFPDPNALMEGQNTTNQYATFQAHQAFYLAVVNLMYLLVSSPSMYAQLGVFSLINDYGVAQFLAALLATSKNFQTNIAEGEIGYGDDESKGEAIASMNLVAMSVEEVMDAVAKTDASSMADKT
ncbi:hypothetical protein P7C71_g2452, partial [Lecanoromycetidae sp. Uapishka_2]